MAKVKAAEALTSVHRLPGWVLGWFYATAAICTWDASFIVLRPRTLPGGILHPFWKPYSIYIDVDQRYSDVNDPFVFGISLFNYAEVILNIITIILHYKNNRHTIPLAFTVSVMTFWKTVFYLYAFTDVGGGAPYRHGNSAWAEFWLFLIPNGVWVVLPFFVMAALWSRITPTQLPVQVPVPVPAEGDEDRQGCGKPNGHVIGSESDSSMPRGLREVFHAKHA